MLRLLHQVQQALEPAKLGMNAEQLACFNEALHRPQGLILVTGPTGSGKTVSLYSALQARNTQDVNICSVEDPIEIPLAGLNQTQINPRSGLTFRVCCGRCFVRIPTSSWWAKSVTATPQRSPSRPRKPGIWCCLRSIPIQQRRRLFVFNKWGSPGG